MPTENAPKPRDHMARVFCTDEAWTVFRQAAQRREIASSAYLGQLVAREVTRLQAAAARAGELGAAQAVAALDEARALRNDIARLTDRLEGLAGQPAVRTQPPIVDPLAERWTIRDGRVQRVGPPAKDPPASDR
jgi:hypothetical protein